MNKVLFSSIVIAMLFAFTACGGGGEKSSDQAEAQESESMGSMDDGVRTVDIFGIDDLKYAVKEASEGLVTGDKAGDYVILEGIQAKPGEQIRIRLTAVSNLPATAMSHNFTLLKMGTEPEEVANASLTARDNDYISPDFEDQIIAHTAMLGNGESGTITFTVPEETGEYDYLCTFPGHYAGGMHGKLIVQ